MKKNNKIHRKFLGRVVSDKMDKTIVVLIDRIKQHPVYKKRIKVSKKFKAHDEKNEARMGDMVEIEECRPISKDKKWKLNKIMRRVEREENDIEEDIKNEEDNKEENNNEIL